MIKSFWRMIRPATLTIISVLLVFSGVIAVVDGDYTAYLLSVKVVAIGYLFYLMLAGLLFKKKQHLTEDYAELKANYADFRESAHQQQAEIEEYFMLWVHQIKTPIFAAYLLSDAPEISQVAIKTQLNKIESYVNMAMNYVKVTDPEADMVLQPVTLDALIRPLLKRYRYQFISQEIQLHYQGLTQAIVTDSHLMQLLIEQIMNNSLKYTQHGNLWITYDETCNELKLKDDGIGIKAEDLPKIFDRGYSGYNGQLNQKSSGIGLYLVLLVSERLNHPDRVASTYGEGTTFYIKCLPVLKEEDSMCDKQ